MSCEREIILIHTLNSTRELILQPVAHLVKGRLRRDQALAVPSSVLPLLCFNGRELLGGGGHFLSQAAIGGSSRLQGLSASVWRYLLLLFCCCRETLGALGSTRRAVKRYGGVKIKKRGAPCRLLNFNRPTKKERGVGADGQRGKWKVQTAATAAALLTDCSARRLSLALEYPSFSSPNCRVTATSSASIAAWAAGVRS